MKFCAQCLDCRGKPSKFDTYDDRSEFVVEHQAVGHSVHIWIGD